ncbi:MAG: DUF3626 domain-containing protein [Candidatus Riflebacteria bacterium]|nr:DUF3626 domain-containing protein [Candidatus Riflebacteria bacterium]
MMGQGELAYVLVMSNITKETFEAAEKKVKEHARVALHFHPDRISKSGRTVAQALAEEGLYKNQFETNLSSGKLDPQAEGIRAGWEDNLFGRAFSTHGAKLSERPKYGALHLMLYPDGPCPRFGSCYFLLNPMVSRRCTFTYMDSHRNPAEKGTLKVFEPIMAALMTECFERRFALGKHDISPSKLINHLLTKLEVPFPYPAEDPAEISLGRNLNHYIEAQVHGDILLSRDVQLLVADPCFRGSSIEKDFQGLCGKYEIELLWHGGFRLPVNKVPEDFRGPNMPSLAKRVSTKDYVDALMIGKAAADLSNNPEKWADRGTYEVVLQELKCLWHVIVQFGEPVS